MCFFFRCHFERTSESCFRTLKHVLLTYPSITLSKVNLQMINLYLCRAKVSHTINNALQTVRDIVEKHDSNADVQSYVSLDLIPSLCLIIQNKKTMPVYENAIQLLLLLRHLEYGI
jgi:hypothetical protein